MVDRTICQCYDEDVTPSLETPSKPLLAARMHTERLQLAGLDRAKYFAPVALCGYVAALCVALIATAPFLTRLHDRLAIAAAGFFGLFLTSLLGAFVFGMQRRELRYWSCEGKSDAQDHFNAVRTLALEQGWRITRDENARQLEFRTAGSLLQQGEFIAVRFRGSEVLIACICDPSVGFSLTGRQRCLAHRACIVQVVQSPVRSVSVA